MAKEYTVKKMQERSRLNEAGEVERYYHIEAVTVQNILFTLDVPEGQAEPENVKKLLAEKAKRLDSIKAS